MDGMKRGSDLLHKTNYKSLSFDLFTFFFS